MTPAPSTHRRERWTHARAVWRRVRGGGLTPTRAGASVGLGLFVGALPLYGLHMPLILAVGVPLRLDAVVAYLVAHFNNPLTAPFLIALEVEIGSLILAGRHAALDVERARETGIAGFVSQAAVGSLAFGLCLGLAGGLIAARIARARRPYAFSEAVERTLARYRHAPRGDRWYVAAKLRSDPVVQAVTELAPLGDVFDVGAGRGQLSLLTLDDGAASSVRGIDVDARKVNVASGAAGGDAEFGVADARDVAFDSFDTILLVDCLHYMPVRDQDELIARCAGALRPGGRLVIREADCGAGVRAWVTSSVERLAVLTGFNRGETHWRPVESIVAALRSHDLESRSTPLSLGTPFSNVLVVAQRRP